MPDSTSALYLGSRVLLAGEYRPGVPDIAFCLRADHSAVDVARVAAVLGRLARGHCDWVSSASLFPRSP